MRQLPAAVGHHLTRALTNAALYTSLRRQLSQTQTLSPIRAPAVAAPVRDQGMWGIIKRFLETMQVDRCAITLAAPGETTAHLIAGYDQSKENPWVQGIYLSLDRYPEIRRGLGTGPTPVRPP